MMTVKDKSKEMNKHEINFCLRNVSLSLVQRNLISRTVERKWTRLLRLSKDVLDCQLEDGIYKLFRHNFNSTRSYAALRVADLEWIVGPGYSLGQVHSGEKQ